jgi:hypothetical protein
MGRRLIDWDPVEVDVRLGKLDKTAIAEKHCVSYSGLRAKIKQYGWESDLTPVIQAATRAELTKQARMRVATDEVVVSSTKAKVQLITQGIDAAVAENVDVINRHRRMADALMRLASDLTQTLIVLNQSTDTEVKKTLTLIDRVTAVRQLAQAVNIIVGIERQAHNLDEKPEAKDSLGEWLATLHSPYPMATQRAHSS